MENHILTQGVLSMNDFHKLHKLKEEYSTVTNDINAVMLWMQREILASQTLSDLALNNRRDDDDRNNMDISEGENNPNISHSDPSKEEQEEQFVTIQDLSKERRTSSESEMWGQYIPPSKTTFTTLDNINNTERSILPIATSRSNNKPVGEDHMLDIAQALEDLSCDKKRSTAVPMETPGPKPKKRRRRRHEIARNFKCNLNGCTKSYGSEGALKTHIRLKHAEGHDHRKREKESKTAPWANAVTAGLSPVILPQLPSVFKSLAGENLPPPRMPPTYHDSSRILPQHNPLQLQPNALLQPSSINMGMDSYHSNLQSTKMAPMTINNQLPSFNSLLNNINSM